MIDALNRLLAPLRRRVDNMVARAVLRLARDDAALQVVQLGIQLGEVRDRCERFQEYGFTSVPLPGAEAVVAFVGGYRDHPLVIAIDDRRHRKMGLAAGEVALYTDEGDFVHLKRGRIIDVVAGDSLRVTAPTVTIIASEKVRMETPLLEVTGDIRDRTEEPDGMSLRGMREVYNDHVHPENDDAPNPTEEPDEKMDGEALP
jgi:phage baseplate assembly protein V